MKRLVTNENEFLFKIFFNKLKKNETKKQKQKKKQDKNT